ncbi:MAG: hypothetical protein K5656_08905 [Lachnospiraceae bacterium]|nr:hypothetical protein [Lachnospiraceae bacterium]
MKVGEARLAYSAQLKAYNMEAFNLSEKKKDLEKQMKYDPDNADMYEEQLKAININYDAVKEKYEEYRGFMEKVTEQWVATMNMEASKQQGEAMAESAEEMGKIIEIARRLMKGDTVPYTDEKKLMEFDDKIYQMAKNMQMMAQLEEKRHKNHESLWEDEEPKEVEDPMETADNEELAVSSEAPEIVDVETTIENSTK